MEQDQTTQIHFGDLLKTLESYPRLGPYNLALYCEQEGLASGSKSQLQLCGSIGENSLCDNGCRIAHEKAARKAIADDQPEVFRCPTGLLNFAVPFNAGDPQSSCCILGGGIREEAMNLAQLEALSNAASADGQALLERLEALPSATREDVEDTAREVHRLIPSLLGKNLHATALERTTRHLQTLTEISSEIDRVESVEELVTLLADTLVILYDLPGMVAVVADEQAGGYMIQETLGRLAEGGRVASNRIEEFLSRHPEPRPVTLGTELRELLPGVQAKQAIALPLCGDGEPFGLLLMLDGKLVPRERMMAELIGGRAAARLLRIRRAREHQQESSFSSRLITMISALALVENRSELFERIVDMAAELLRASRGSLMLIDESGQSLKIVATKGMNQALARSMKVEFGDGIAGRVAKSGFPLLVNDIEKDRRIASPNRPRFRTKSFISLPFKVKEKTIGVLNLADKENHKVFIQTDLDLLATFAAHASLMIDRASSLERSLALEEMSVTDPLTGIYNRRMLEERLGEELSRSTRQKLNFTVMLIDLDHFKIYNDLCGHIAGDNALKKSAALLMASARDMDVVTRYGGEEFCIVLPGTSKKESILVAERIRRAIENHPFPGETGLPHHRLTASVGVASFPDDGDTATGLINAADIALYQAKSEGRNRILFYEPAMRESRENHG